MNDIFPAAPDPARPIMMMRLRAGHEKPEVWNALFPELIANKACCDEVWFSTGIGFPPLDVHRENSRLMGEHAEALRREGFIPGLQQKVFVVVDFPINVAGLEVIWELYKAEDENRLADLSKIPMPFK